MKKKLLTVLLAVVMVFGVFGLTACGGSNKDEDYNYYGVKYSIEDEVKIEAVTFQAVYKMFTTPGKFVLYVNSGESAADFQAVNKLANDWDVTIYHFNPDLTGGYAKGLSNAVNGNICSDLTGIAGESQLKAVQDLLISISKKDLAFWKEADGKILGISGADSTVSAKGELQYKGSVAAANTIADGAKSIAAVSIKNPSYGSYTDDAKDVPYIPAAYNTDAVGTMNLFADARLHIYDDRDAITEEKTDVFVTVANYEMFAHLLDNNDGYFAVFFGGTWCPNTQAILYHVNYLAKDYGMNKVYFFDPRLDDGVRLDQVVATTAFDQNAYDKDVAVAESAATIAKLAADKAYSSATLAADSAIAAATGAADKAYAAAKSAAATAYDAAKSAAAGTYAAAIGAADKVYADAKSVASEAYDAAMNAANEAQEKAYKAAQKQYEETVYNVKYAQDVAEDAVEAKKADLVAAKDALEKAEDVLEDLVEAGAAATLDKEIKAAKDAVAAAKKVKKAAQDAVAAAQDAYQALCAENIKKLQYALDVKNDAQAAWEAVQNSVLTTAGTVSTKQQAYDSAVSTYNTELGEYNALLAQGSSADPDALATAKEEADAALVAQNNAFKELTAAKNAYNAAVAARKPAFDARNKAAADYADLQASTTAAEQAAAALYAVDSELALAVVAAQEDVAAAELAQKVLEDRKEAIVQSMQVIFNDANVSFSNVVIESLEDLAYVANRLVADYQKDLVAAQATLKAAQAELSEAQAELAKVEKVLKEKETALSRAEATFATYTKNIAIYEDKNTVLDAEDAKLEATNLVLSEELTWLIIQGIDEARYAAVEAEIAKNNERRTAIAQEKAQNNDAITAILNQAGYQTANTALLTAQSEVTGAQSDVAAKQAIVDSKQAAISAYVDTNNDDVLDAIQGAQVDVDYLNATIAYVKEFVAYQNSYVAADDAVEAAEKVATDALKAYLKGAKVDYNKIGTDPEDLYPDEQAAIAAADLVYVAAELEAIFEAEKTALDVRFAAEEAADVAAKEAVAAATADKVAADAAAEEAKLAAYAAADADKVAADAAAEEAKVAADAAAEDAKVAAVDAANAAYDAAYVAAIDAKAAAIEAADAALAAVRETAGNVTTYAVAENKQNITGNLNTRNNDATGAAYNYNFTYGSFLANYLPTYWSEWNITAKLTITVGSTTSEFTRMCVPNIMMFNGEKADAKAELIALAEAEYYWADTSVEGNPYRLAWESAVKEVFDANPYATYAPIVVAPEASTDSAAGGAAPSAPAAGAGDSAC